MLKDPGARCFRAWYLYQYQIEHVDELLAKRSEGM